ncbi:hypothetical protein H5410_037946 [Solanum commersonii]|uniref:MATH domain-containing protein n=1 Tax=Solanum commersonii TaxID=4109 RepID=A0A9J5Y9C2_SOLCO|nr:hypothetical protein H5410_037946 [Solanum commersonii]
MYHSDRSLYVMYRSDTFLYEVSVEYITLRCIGTYVMYRDRVALTSLNQMNLRLLVISGTTSLPANWEVNAICTFFLFNQLRDNFLSVRGKMRHFQPIKSIWGLPKFLSHNTFKEASNGYLVDDKCVFGAEIFIVQRQAIGECLSMVKSTDSFKREWKICNFSKLGENWVSEEFPVGGCKWKLSLYPKGNANNKGCDISIFLKSVNAKDFDHHEKVKEALVVSKGQWKQTVRDICDISIFLKSVDAKDFDHHQKVKANCSINLKDQINGGCKKAILRMIVYPDGNTYENGSGHISVYLAISGTTSLPANWEVNAICTFFLFNQLCDNYLLVRGKMRHFQPIKSIWGLPKFLSHNTFKEASNGYLVDDKCVFGAEIFIVQRQAIGECLSMVKSTDSFKREWKICNFSKLGENWISEEFTVGGYKWKLSLYPKGNANNKGCDISIFLKSVDAKDFDHHEKVKVNGSLNLKDQTNVANFYMEFLRDEYHYDSIANCIWFSTTIRSWGFPGFMPLTQLRDQKKGYLVNDCIVVEVELKVEFKHSRVALTSLNQMSLKLVVINGNDCSSRWEHR